MHILPDIPTLLPKRTLATRWRAVLAIDPIEASIERRGFRRTDQAQRLEAIGYAFLHGYQALLDCDDPAGLPTAMTAVEPALLGFAYEGAGMASALLDALPCRNGGRLGRLLQGPGAPYGHLVHVGAGWAMARLPWKVPRSAQPKLDPLLSWLAVDGYGFHHGYFFARSYISEPRRRWRARGYTFRALDQGLGRSLWFVEGADVQAIAWRLRTFEPERRADLWSGVGLAVAYAGGADHGGLTYLRSAAGPYLPQLAQGVAFAAKARARAGQIPEHTEGATQTVCGISATAAAEITDQALRDLQPDGSANTFESWRSRIQANFPGASTRGTHV